MQKITEQVLQTALKADNSLDQERIDAALAILRGEGATNAARDGLPMLLTQTQTAKKMQVSRFTLRRLEQSGKLKPIYITPALKRYRLADVEALATRGAQ